MMTTVINTYAGVDVFCIDHPACCCCCCCCCYRINKNVRCGRRSVRYGTILVVVSIQSNPIQSNAICLYQHILVPIRSVISHTTCNHHNNNLTTALAYMRVDRTFRFPAVAVAVLCFIRKIELYGMVLRCELVATAAAVVILVAPYYYLDRTYLILLLLLLLLRVWSAPQQSNPIQFSNQRRTDPVRCILVPPYSYCGNNNTSTTSMNPCVR